eukprot:101581_1
MSHQSVSKSDRQCHQTHCHTVDIGKYKLARAATINGISREKKTGSAGRLSMYRKTHHLLVKLGVPRSSNRHPLPHGLVTLIKDALPDEPSE